MNPSALVRRMTEAGATPEAIAIALEAIEAVETRETERKAKRAAQKRKERSLSNDSSATVARQGSDKEATVASETLPEVPPRDITQPLPNPPISSLRSESRPKRVRTLASDDFETGFWKLYPTTPPMSKAEAWKAWQKLGSEEREAVKSSVPDFVAYCRSHPEYPVVHACRYITKRKFEGFLPQPNVVALNSRVFVLRDSPQWTAWTRYLGKAKPAMWRGNEQGWYFESEWPPDATITSPTPLPKLDEASASSCSASEREGQGRHATEARFAFAR